jgi:hypothetical protein
VQSFLRQNDKYNTNPTKSEPQGFISVDIEEQKLPPIGDDLVRQSAKCVGMLSSEWQTAQFAESDEERQQAPKFNWDGKFVANPQVIGGWKLVGQTDTIEAFDPAKPSACEKAHRHQPATRRQGRNRHSTAHLVRGPDDGSRPLPSAADENQNHRRQGIPIPRSRRIRRQKPSRMALPMARFLTQLSNPTLAPDITTPPAFLFI